MTAALYNTTTLVKYGAVELKKLSGRYAFYGLFLSVGIIGAVFLLLYVATSLVGERTVADTHIEILGPITIAPLSILVEKPRQPTTAPPATNRGGAGDVVSVPVVPTSIPVADNISISTPVFSEEQVEIANNNGTSVDALTSNGNGGTLDGGTPWNNGNGTLGGTESAIASDGDDGVWNEVPDVFPQIDMQQLQRNIAYPDGALRRELEGKVVVAVLIDAKGKVVASSIEQSTNEIFNNAAIEAVRKSTFTPAFRNGKPVPFRFMVPVSFRMR